MHIEKVKLAGAFGDLAHNGRTESYEGSDSRIDHVRTRLNYALTADGQRVTPTDLRKHASAMLTSARKQHEETTGKRVRKDAVGMISVVCTLPADWPSDLPVASYFALVNDWARERFPGRLIGSFVHMDETTPHAHVDLLPMADGKLNANKLLTRQVYRKAHDDLQAYADERLPCHVSIKLADEDVIGKALSKVPHDKLDEIRQAFDQRVRDLNQFEASLYARQIALDERERELDQREIACGIAEERQAHPAPMPVRSHKTRFGAVEDKSAPDWPNPF